MEIIGTVVAALAGMVVAFLRGRAVKRQRLHDAEVLVQEGIDAHDPSKITAGFDRLRHL
jgi:hypothetical protein